MNRSEPTLPISTADFPKGFAFWVVLIVGVMASVVSPIAADLLFGWFFFLNRSLTTFQPDGPTFWVGVGAFALLFAIVHRIGSRSAARSRWTWRSTTALCLGITLLFAASVAMVASLHQVIWLASHSGTASRQAARWSRPAGPLSFIAQARQAAWRSESRNNLRRIMLQVESSASFRDEYPPGTITGPDGQGERGWVAMSLSGFFTAENYDWYKKKWDDPAVAETGKGAIPFLMHPELGWHGQFDERGFALMHYAGNVHVFPNNRGLKISEITDGTSNTLAIGEVAENFQPWASPWNRRDPADGINDVPWGFGGPPWQEGAQFALMDGSVRFISRNIDRQVLKALGTPAGNEKIPDRFVR